MKLYQVSRLFCLLLFAFAAGCSAPQPPSQPEKPIGEIGRRESLRWRYFITVTPEQIKAARNAQDSYPAEDDRDGKWGPTWEGLQLSIRLQKESFTSGEPVVACVTLRNAGDKVQYFEIMEPLPEKDTKIFLMRDGKRILGLDDSIPNGTFAEILRGIRQGRSWSEPISPGTQRQFFRDLSKLFDLSAIGNYTAQAERTVIAADNLPDRPGYIRAVTSNLLSGTVTFRIGTSNEVNNARVIRL